MRSGHASSQNVDGLPGIGEIKWFGGINNATGRHNNFGFISTDAGDLYFHRSSSLSPPEILSAGAKVAFIFVEEAKGKVAKSVQVISKMDDEALTALIKGASSLGPKDVMSVIPFMKSIDAVQEEAFQALSILVLERPLPPAVSKFWAKYEPAGPNDRFLAIAPSVVKAKYYKKYFVEFRASLNNLFSSIISATTALPAVIAYGAIDERDMTIAKEWAGNINYDTPIANAVLAKMLSARGAEKAAKWFYEGVGVKAEDISIRQIEGRGKDWLTHDLLLDSTLPIDVKNARRPINASNFYVEHTIPKFKINRQNVHVRIAGILSPYLNYRTLQEPTLASFKIDDLIFLGETSRQKIERLAADFESSEFEVTRSFERTFPNWVFAYPEAWYRVFSEDVRRFVGDCDWPKESEWEFVLDESERIAAVPALCVSGKPLPIAILAKLSPWQAEFYSKLQSLTGNCPEVPVIFFTILTDFLARLKNGGSDYSPEGYLPLLYPEYSRYPRYLANSGPLYPLGAIDPLGLVAGLIETLTELWEGREKTNLDRFSNFRFGGLGILQGRERNCRNWTTIIAYCGGTVFDRDNDGNVLLNLNGKPIREKGKCGNAPLIIGDSAACTTCGKLICKKCGFCSQPCQDRQFAAQAETKSKEHQRSATAACTSHESDSEPPWLEIPMEAYVGEFQRRKL